MFRRGRDGFFCDGLPSANSSLDRFETEDRFVAGSVCTLERISELLFLAIRRRIGRRRPQDNQRERAQLLPRRARKNPRANTLGISQPGGLVPYANRSRLAVGSDK